MPYTYDQIVPTEMQEELIIMRDRISCDSWRLGDLVIYDLQYCESQGIFATMQEIYSAIGNFAGKSARTIREYASVAQFFPPETRLQYDVLSFDHFRHAKRFFNREIEALEWAVDQVIHLNRPATVDAMILHFTDPEASEQGQMYVDQSLSFDSPAITSYDPHSSYAPQPMSPSLIATEIPVDSDSTPLLTQTLRAVLKMINLTHLSDRTRNKLADAISDALAEMN